MRFKLDDKGINKALVPKASEIRGFVINQTIVVERLIDRFLCMHFADSEDKRFELMEKIFSASIINFDQKKRLLFELLKSEQYKNNVEQFTSLFDNIQDIQKHRNIFAHSVLNTSVNSIDRLNEGYIGFIKFHGSTTLYEYNQQEMQNLLKELEYVIRALMTLTKTDIEDTSLPL